MKRVLWAWLVVGVTGCTMVHPWQRETLASPAMQFEPNPFAMEQEASIRAITEGATYAGGGPGSAGGGCGCH
jgi:hypothetical protein